MTNKICSLCAFEKPLMGFHRHTANKSGYRAACKDCRKKDSIANRAQTAEYNRVYRIKNTEVLKKKRESNTASLRASSKNHYLNNKEYYQIHNKLYYQTHKARLNGKKTEYIKSRYVVDPLFRLKCLLRTAVKRALKEGGYEVRSRTCRLLGTDYATVNQHLIDSAKRNYGKYFPKRKYHIDHIAPCANAKTEDALIILQNYTNLQYLYPKDNRDKSDKLNFCIKKR